jgi:uroporphyrinogen-III synthase
MSEFINIASARILKPELKQKALELGFKINDYDLLKYSYSQNLQQYITSGQSMPFVFTSVHGVKALVDFADKSGLSFKGKEAYCIKGQTSERADKAGFAVKATAIDGKTLAQQILDHQEAAVMHFSANIRRDELKHILTENGVKYHVCEAYHKEKCAVKFEPFDAVMFFSPSQIDVFFEKNELDANTPAFCIGETTAGHLASFQHKSIIIAGQPSVESVLESVFNYYKVTT